MKSVKENDGLVHSRPTTSPELDQTYANIQVWILEETGFYDPYSGITNNASESFNVVLKWMNDQGLTNVLPGCQGQVQNLVRQVHFSVVCPAGQVQILIFQVFRTVRQLVIYYQRDKKWHPTDSQ